jgi:hypothetical protein
LKKILFFLFEKIEKETIKKNEKEKNKKEKKEKNLNLNNKLIEKEIENWYNICYQIFFEDKQDLINGIYKNTHIIGPYKKDFKTITYLNQLNFFYPNFDLINFENKNSNEKNEKKIVLNESNEDFLKIFQKKITKNSFFITFFNLNKKNFKIWDIRGDFSKIIRSVDFYYQNYKKIFLTKIIDNHFAIYFLKPN